MDLSHLLKDNFDEPFVKQAFGAPLVTVQKLLTDAERPGFPRSARISYKSTDQPRFKLLCKQLGIMDDAKVGLLIFGNRSI